MTPASLYVHAPFCARRCCYCDFAVTVASTPPVEAWLECIATELRTTVDAHGWSRLALETLYVGGGTPSLLGPGVMESLAARLRERADWDDEALEWTAEANPERFDSALADDWARAGVHRVSLGVQTFDPSTLQWMGRLHGPEGPATAVRAARAAGIGSVSVDLIFGLPARHPRNWAADLDRALDLGPDHVSLYGLTAEKGTPLGRWVEEGRECLPDESTYADEYLIAVDRLTSAGFVHYEVSNFARPGHASRHNRGYWTGAPYLGLGPGAHSYVRPVRWWNVRDWAAYRERIGKSGTAVEAEETVGGREAELERTWLALRTMEGLSSDGATAAQRALAETWRSRGWAVREPSDAASGRVVRLTAGGWLLLDRLAVEWDGAGGVGASGAAGGARKSAASAPAADAVYTAGGQSGTRRPGSPALVPGEARLKEMARGPTLPLQNRSGRGVARPRDSDVTGHD